MVSTEFPSIFVRMARFISPNSADLGSSNLAAIGVFARELYFRGRRLDLRCCRLDLVGRGLDLRCRRLDVRRRRSGLRRCHGEIGFVAGVSKRRLFRSRRDLGSGFWSRETSVERCRFWFNRLTEGAPVKAGKPARSRARAGVDARLGRCIATTAENGRG